MNDDKVLTFDSLQKTLMNDSGTEGYGSNFARVPGYLDSESEDKDGVIDHNGTQLGATVLLPAMTLDLPMNHRGEPIDIEVEDPIFGWGYPEPRSDNLSAAANESRRVTVKVSVKIHGWEFGWPEETQTGPEAELATSAASESASQQTD